MLLRIIDKGDSKGIVVEFTSEKQCEYYEITEYESPYSQNILALLDWYFTDYAIGSADIKDDRRVMEKLITQSQYLGDAIIGEDHELIRFKDYIEDSGYENVEVRIESDRHDFFCELWETIILPNSKYFLSTVVREFSRTFCTRDRQSLPEIEFGLNVTPPVSKQISQMLDDGPSKSEQESAPLNILYLVSRDLNGEDKESSIGSGIGHGESCALNLALEHVNTEGAIDIEVWPLEDWGSVTGRLKNTDKPIHIVHFDGPVLLDGDKAFLVSQSQDGEDAKLAVANFARLLIENKAALLTLDTQEYIDKEKTVSHAYGLAIVARIAENVGLGNVVGLSHKTSVWQSSDCFKSLYQQIAGSHSLNRAVVEARKSLQSYSETTFSNIRKLPFQKWPLLVHYSHQKVTFFKEPQICVNPEEAHTLNISRSKLFGFQAAMLPPKFLNISDHGLLTALASLNHYADPASNKIITLLGDAGIGKTQLSHTLSFYLAGKKIIHFGFYFDFERDLFSSSDIKEMIAPILQADSETVLETLKSRRCCFVFDGLQPSTLDDLKSLVENLLSQGHIVIGCGRELNGLLFEHAAEIKHLTSQEKNVFALQILDKRKINLDLGCDNWVGDFYTLLEKTTGNPFLIKNLVALLESHSPDELYKLIKSNFIANEQISLVEQFYRWQWSQTHDFWKAILLLASQTHNLLIEIIMIAWQGDDSANIGGDLKKAVNKILAIEATPDLEGGLSDMIKQWDKQGFIKSTSTGHIVDPYFLSKISTLISEETPVSKVLLSDEVKLTFSRLICEGLTRLSSHFLKQQDQQLLQYIISNRRTWVDHFERLWQSEDYKGFFSVKNVFDQILIQGKIGDESAEWSLDLSNRTDFDIANHKTGAVTKLLAWLTLATSGLACQALDAVRLEREFSEVYKKVEPIQDWLDANSFDDQEGAGLFFKVCFFLEAFYLKTENWNQLIALGQKTYTLFLEKEIWISAIKMLKLMSSSYVKLNQLEDASVYEEKLIHEISYEGSPPGYKSQVLFEVVFSRIARKDYSLALDALNEIKKNDDAKNIDEVIQGVQSEIFYETGEYKLALPHYSKLWARALQAQDQQQLTQIKDRLINIKNKIGEEDFSRIFTLETPQGVIDPETFNDNSNELALH